MHPPARWAIGGRLPTGDALRTTLAVGLVALKPVADALSERSRDTQLDLGTLWTAAALLLIVAWFVARRIARAEAWSLTLAIATILLLGALQAALQSGIEALVESAKVAVGFVPAVLLLDASGRPHLSAALKRWAPVFVASVGLHVVVAWLQFVGLVSTTYQQAGMGRPSGLFFHPVTLGYVLVASLLVIAILHQRHRLGTPLALVLATVTTLTVAIGTHRTSILSTLLVLAAWVLLASLRSRRVRLSRLVLAAGLGGLIVVVAVAALPLWQAEAGRALAGVTSVITSGDLDPSSERFLRGRGQRWAAALAALAEATPAERLVGFGTQVVDPHTDYLRLPLVHGALGSIVVLSAVGTFWLWGFRLLDGRGRTWLSVALLVGLVFAITTKPTSYPSFVWAWTMVLAVALATRPNTAPEPSTA